MASNDYFYLLIVISWLLFYGMSTLVGYLISNCIYDKNNWKSGLTKILKMDLVVIFCPLFKEELFQTTVV